MDVVQGFRRSTKISHYRVASLAPRCTEHLTLREADIRDLFFIRPEVMSQFVEVGNLNLAQGHGALLEKAITKCINDRAAVLKRLADAARKR